MFPKPNKIIGNRDSLIQSYKDQISKIETKSFPQKDRDCFRFCSYNVKYFEFNG